jgi:septal ring factor EnvC (AmiA/AmiB activator)
MSNLSELSIQLRKLQSTNTSQTAEIDRLNRQLKILSDLQNVSLHDIKDALRAACEGEAHEELRAEVGRLKAQLDCFQATGSSGGTKSAGSVKTLHQFDAEAASRARTNLELRVGELEELEGTLRKELASVYSKAQELTARNTTLETQQVQQKNVIDDWERRWMEREQEDIRKGSVVARPLESSVGSYNYSEFATEVKGSRPQPRLLLRNESQSTHDMQQRLLAAETALDGERQQNDLLKQQVESSQKSYDLKLEQNEHRIQFLEGQIADLEQQLSSLYAAFEFVQQERVEERDQKLYVTLL